MVLSMDFCHIIEKIISNLENIKDCSIIFLNFMTGVIAIRGLNYLKGLKEKTNAATFTFWSQFRYRIYELMNWLESDNTLIDNLYDPKIRKAWESQLTQDMERTKQFKEKVQNAITYIESTPDQMPAYIGWTSDFNEIVSFLNDIIQYDICDEKKHFKFIKRQSLKDKKQYCADKCNVMRRLCTEIEKRQKELPV